MKVFHNPRCRKSRETLEILQAKGVEVDIVEYLKTPPSREEIGVILTLLDIGPQELLRKGEAIFKDQFKGKTLSDDECIDVMVEHPKLIERPIVIAGKRAVIGRPPSRVLELL